MQQQGQSNVDAAGTQTAGTNGSKPCDESYTCDVMHERAQLLHLVLVLLRPDPGMRTMYTRIYELSHITEQSIGRQAL